MEETDKVTMGGVSGAGAPVKPLSNAARLGLAGALLAVVAVWGWTFVVVKDAVAVCGVLPFLTVRFALGAACLGAAGWRRIDRRTLRAGGAIGVVLGAGFLLQTMGLARMSASSNGLITGLFVVFAQLSNRFLFGVRTPGPFWIAIFLSLAGLALLTGTAPSGFGAGEGLTLGCAAMFGLHVALLDRHARAYDATALAFGQLAAAAVLFGLAWAVSGPMVFPSARVWPALLLTGVVASAGAYVVQTRVQQRLPAVEASMIMLTEPVFAVLFACALQGDRLTPLQVVGGLLMVATMGLAELRPRAPSPPSQ